MTCDWLKECGCVWLAKPDVHINGVVDRLQPVNVVKDKDVLWQMYSWSEAIKQAEVDLAMTAYKLDKIIWLLCTGDFYLDNKRTGREAIYKKIDSLE